MVNYMATIFFMKEAVSMSKEEQELKAYKDFYNKVQYVMDNAFDSRELIETIDRLTEDCIDALSIRH